MTRRPPPSNTRPSNRDDSSRPHRTRAINGVPYPGAPDPSGSSAQLRRATKTAGATNRARESTPTPPTVWTTGPEPIDPATNWPIPIVETITTSLSARGARVLLTAWPTTARNRELIAACDAVRVLERDAAVADFSPAAPAGEMSGPRTSRRRAVRGGASSEQNVDRPQADLIITALPPNHGFDASFAMAAARRLTFGGILAVYTHCDWSTGRLIDRSGAVIAAAQNADLLYLQHIVTLHTPIRNCRLQPPSQARGPVRGDAVHSGSPAPHTRVHGDVLVFAQAQADTADL
ncbi:hypothetical protein [Amycolatopsis sp. NPDC004625]|uniref:hypothetical protein n=1 Tax=Amycolatopsis sp. NPDC004625 TaxID=3154670 RepID=UPI0033AB5C42